MKTNLSARSLLFVAALFFSVSSSLPAASILGINFHGETTDGDTEGRTLFGTSQWTNLGGASGTAVPIVGTSTVAVTYSSIGVYKGGWGNNYNGEFACAPFWGYLDDGASGVSVTLSGLREWMTSGGFMGYTVSVLRSTDTNGATFQPVNLTAGTYNTSLVASSFFNGTWDGNIQRDPASTTSGTRAMTTSGQILTTEDVLMLQINARSGTARGTLAGIVITGVPVPEPSVYLLSLAAFAGIILRRRRLS